MKATLTMEDNEVDEVRQSWEKHVARQTRIEKKLDEILALLLEEED